MREILVRVREDIYKLVQEKPDGLDADECSELRTFGWTLLDPLRGKKTHPILPVRMPYVW